MGADSVFGHHQQSEEAEAQSHHRVRGDQLGREVRAGQRSGGCQGASDTAFIEDASSPHFAGSSGPFADQSILNLYTALTKKTTLSCYPLLHDFWIPRSLVLLPLPC